MAQERAEKNVEKNKKLMKDFNGPRTFKDDDGKVRPTKEWAAYLKKHGSSVVAKSQLKTKPDHITQITNAWIEKHGPKPVKPGFKPVGKDPNHKHSGKKNY
jgi:predicted GNAT family acetyltransferase